jgi:hypothetical protein
MPQKLIAATARDYSTTFGADCKGQKHGFRLSALGFRQEVNYCCWQSCYHSGVGKGKRKRRFQREKIGEIPALGPRGGFGWVSRLRTDASPWISGVVAPELMVMGAETTVAYPVGRAERNGLVWMLAEPSTCAMIMKR